MRERLTGKPRAGIPVRRLVAVMFPAALQVRLVAERSPRGCGGSARATPSPAMGGRAGDPGRRPRTRMAFVESAEKCADGDRLRGPWPTLSVRIWTQPWNRNMCPPSPGLEGCDAARMTEQCSACRSRCRLPPAARSRPGPPLAQPAGLGRRDRPGNGSVSAAFAAGPMDTVAAPHVVLKRLAPGSGRPAWLTGPGRRRTLAGADACRRGAAGGSAGDAYMALILWWAHQDSNLEPRDYESPALTN